MEKVYAFTNENIASYNELYNFSNAKVLSVLGSGDQYFMSILYGADEVELYDIEPLTWDYFILKFFAIKTLDYEEFYDYFVTKQLNDNNYFNRIIANMPTEFVNMLYKKNNNLSSMVTYIDTAPIDYDNGTIIPYLKKEKYYKLQEKILNKDLPKFYNSDFKNLPEKLSDKSYDIILASNIFYWMYLDNEQDNITEFKSILDKFNFSKLQALYCWWLNPDFKVKLEENGFEIDTVNSSRSLKLSDDYVISLTKK